MTERPILFSAPMVRAILEGTKTQTRRVVKPQPEWDGKWFKWDGHRPGSPYGACSGNTLNASMMMGWSCPYGQPGDRLWVRETWAHGIHAMAAVRDQDGPFVYAATDRDDQRLGDRWRPSIHMPRCASRITLELTGVRVERLWEVSETDAVAEGVASITVSDGGASRWVNYSRLDSKGSAFGDARSSYRSLWEEINGQGSWDANPWVWVVEFERK